MFRWCFGAGILGSYMAQIGNSCGLNHPRCNFTMRTICTKDLTSEMEIMILENYGLLNETHRHVHVIHMYITICFYTYGVPVVPARGGAEAALNIYIYETFLIYRTCMRRAPAKPVRACTLRTDVLFHMSHLKLHFALPTSHCSLHTPHFTLHTSHCTLHNAPFAVNTSLHTAPLRLHTWHHTSHATLNTSQFTLHTALFTPHTSHCTKPTCNPGAMQGQARTFLTLHIAPFTLHIWTLFICFHVFTYASYVLLFCTSGHLDAAQAFSCVTHQPESEEPHRTTQTWTSILAKHIGGTIRAQNDPSRTRRTDEVPFIAGCSHFTRKNTRFRAPASSPQHSPCNIHAAIPMRSATTASRTA